MNADLISKLIDYTRKQRTEEFDPDLLKKNLSEAENIRMKLAGIKYEEKKLQRHIDDWKAKIRDMKNKMYEDCGHPVTTYYGDASGGSDSHTCCDVCECDTINRVGGYDG